MSEAIILTNVRRKLDMLSKGEVITISSEKKYDFLLPGDKVTLSDDSSNPKVISAKKRKNLVKRSTTSRTKEIVCNLSALCLVTAPLPLFNPQTVDRVICLANEQSIPVYLIFNKSDLGLQSVDKEIEYYRSVVSDVICTSTKTKDGLAPLEELIYRHSGEMLAMSGVSGVGKSSLLSRLLGYQIHTNEVSDKTGQGRQTTSRTEGHYYAPTNSVLYDVPGIQSFGLAHLELENLSEYFTDIYQIECPFRGCRHLAEQECKVKEAVANEDLLKSRYQSYLAIYQELKSARGY